MLRLLYDNIFLRRGNRLVRLDPYLDFREVAQVYSYP